MPNIRIGRMWLKIDNTTCSTISAPQVNRHWKAWKRTKRLRLKGSISKKRIAGLSDPGLEEALYDSVVMRQFVGIDLGRDPVPDATTAYKFRHLLEEHALGEEILQRVNLYLQSPGVRITTGTIVDAT